MFYSSNKSFHNLIKIFKVSSQDKQRHFLLKIYCKFELMLAVIHKD